MNDYKKILGYIKNKDKQGLKEYLKKRKWAKTVDRWDDFTFGRCFRPFPSSFYILNDEETIRRETDKAFQQMVETVARYSKEDAEWLAETIRKRRMNRNNKQE